MILFAGILLGFLLGVGFTLGAIWRLAYVMMVAAPQNKRAG